MIQKPKGTLDYINKDGYMYNYLYNYTMNFMHAYNYDFIKTPTFESTDLFYRGVGETTDVVNKETYDFIDKGDRKMTLRPEFTAGVVRSYIENKMYTDEVKKLYYYGSAFRYERPQSGRLREFTQMGVEVFGVKNPNIDAEVISLAYKYLSGLGIENLHVVLNTLGDNESRNNYNKVIREYLEKDKDNLCEICKERLNKNPLRILDCKYDSEREYIKNAPKTVDYLKEKGKKIFLDLKFHDIPNTMQSAVRAAVRDNVWLMTIHVSDMEGMRQCAVAAKEEAEKLGIEKPIIVGVTVLTSLSNQDLQDIGCNMTTEELAIKRAKLAKEAGIDGIVCSAQEVDKIVEACGKDFVTVCPGIRPANASVGDQKRVVTPKDAINKGAHYLVVGRPITKAENPSEAAINIVKEIENA